MHLHEEAREAGWTDEQILEAIARVALETFTAMVNVAGDVPVDGSVEDSRHLGPRERPGPDASVGWPHDARGSRARTSRATRPPAARTTTRRSS